VFERYASDPRVTKYLGWPTHRTLDDTRGFLQFCVAEWHRWPVGPFLIESRDTGALLGSTGLGFDSPAQAATGYVLAHDAWGVGYATESLVAMRDLASRLGVKRLYALCHPDHRASARVLDKCGFTLESTLRGHSEFPNLAPGRAADVACYSMRPAIC
jgi:aspartyl-tRNA(Asn)/glutamyl-tRNA(Gln) amidotransferase subunit C/ribosomal-protein-alanine N-acetyltransferase